MYFLAKPDQNEEVMAVTYEQAGQDVFLRLDGLVIGHFVSDMNELTIFKPSVTSKGVNLVVEE